MVPVHKSRDGDGDGDGNCDGDGNGGGDGDGDEYGDGDGSPILSMSLCSYHISFIFLFPGIQHCIERVSAAFQECLAITIWIETSTNTTSDSIDGVTINAFFTNTNAGSVTKHTAQNPHYL